MLFTEITGAVNGTSAYVNGKCLGRDVTVILPEVALLIAEIQAMGTTEIPLLGLLEAMEACIKKIGVDNGLTKACTPESKIYEFRWVHTVTDASGASKQVGCKAVLRAMPKVIMAGVDIEPGSTVEAEIPLATTRYVLYVNGAEQLCIDKLAQVLRIDGKDYLSGINSLL